jgi:two-component system alkaline phosphatase synthesis response regulator PhoP
MAAKRKILVVDDEPDLVDMLKMALQGAGYDVVTAGDGQQGVDLARSAKPDAIVLDIMMPCKDGFQACRELKEDPDTAGIPVSILTAVGSRLTDMKAAKSLGLQLDSEDYIDKPVDTAVLLQRVARQLNR